MIEQQTFSTPMSESEPSCSPKGDGHQITVRALLGLPKGASAEHPVPVVLHIHGGGQTASAENVEFFCSLGLACMSFDWSGLKDDRNPDEVTRYPKWMESMRQQPALDRVRDNGLASLPQYQGIGIARACLDRLTADARVRSDRIGVYGISWGGLMTWIVNGTDARVRCAVPVYGVGGVRERDMPFVESWNGIPTEVRHTWTTTMEPLAYASRQHGAVLVVGATNDFFGSPETIARVTSLLPVTYRADYSPNLDHAFDASSARGVVAFLRHYLGDGPPLPASPSIVAQREPWGIMITSDRDGRRRSLWYASGSGPATHRHWRRVDMDNAANDTTAACVTADVRTPVFCFVRATDANNATLCSDILYVPRLEELGGEHRPGHGTEIMHAFASEQESRHG